jgi:hypothetical protein
MFWIVFMLGALGVFSAKLGAMSVMIKVLSFALTALVVAGVSASLVYLFKRLWSR